MCVNPVDMCTTLRWAIPMAGSLPELPLKSFPMTGCARYADLERKYLRQYKFMYVAKIPEIIDFRDSSKSYTFLIKQA